MLFCQRNDQYSLETDSAQISILLMCSRVQSLLVRKCHISLLEPIFKSSKIQTSLKILKICRWQQHEDLIAFEDMLPRLQCLEEFHLLGRDRSRPPGESVFTDEFLSRLPRSVRRLVLYDDSRAGTIKHLGFLTTWSYPAIVGRTLPASHFNFQSRGL